jgi:hypothetical protein
MDGNRVVREPRVALFGRVERGVGLYIMRSAFHEFVAKKNISESEAISALTLDGSIRTIKKRRLGTGSNIASPSVMTLEFKYEFLTDLECIPPKD